MRPSRDTRISLALVAFAVVALAMLAVIPWTASRRLSSVRLDTTETLGPARQYVRDISSSLAVEAAARGAIGPAASPELVRRYEMAVATERTRDSALGALAPRLGEGFALQVAELRSSTARWRAERTSAAAAPIDLIDAITVATRLDSAIANLQARQGARVRALESMDVLLPSIVVPLLGALLYMIYASGRKMAALAAAAEESRRAPAVATEKKVRSLRGLTHDLKNTLGAASGFARLLYEGIGGSLTAQQRDYLGRIARLIEKTVVAVEDALFVARTEAGEIPVRRRPEDLRAIVLESVSDFVAAAERAGLALSVDVAETLPVVDTDRSLVSKIVGNLLSNAIKYTPAGGRVQVRARRRDGTEAPAHRTWVAIEVCDTGPGIPAAFRERIFDEFFRTPAAASAAHGDGIGLATSRRVARLLGGDITIDEQESCGAAFTLWLPPGHAEGKPPGQPVNAPDSRAICATSAVGEVVADR